MNYNDTYNCRPLVLVTGANSLLGTNIIECLLGAGYKVRGLLRDARRFYLAPHPSLLLVEGDFTFPETVCSAVQGCEYVIHIAACTDQNISDYGHYHTINVEASHRLFMAALQAGVKRFIYVSSANCFGFGDKEKPGDETLPAKQLFKDSHYARSKQEAQEMLLNLKHLMDIVVVNPTFMLGKYDSKPSSGQIILMGYRKKIVFCPPGGKNFICASNAATGVVNALRHGQSGEAYLLSGENLTYREFFGRLADVTGSRTRCVTIPRWFLSVVGHSGNFLQKIGISNPCSLTNMKILCIGNYYINTKAVKELSLRTHPIEVGISDALQWFRQKGMIKP